MSENVVPSPPTLRVIQIVELLASAELPGTVADIADRLELSRSTVAAILVTLEERGWVVRLPDLTYRIGSAGVEFGVRASAQLPLGGSVIGEIDGLAQRVGCDAALIMGSATHLAFIYVTTGYGRIPTPLGTGARIPLRAPMGATMVAYASPSIQQQWLDTAPPEWRQDFADVFEQIHRTGVTAWGLDTRNLDTIMLLGDIANHLIDDAATALRERVIELLTGLSLRPYLAQTLATDRALPISCISAPVFNTEGDACWELQLGPMHPAMPRAERDRCMDELACTANSLSKNIHP
ncbi:helix-turn-helix domain-containing protein [Mycobacterium sp. PDNC021]|uniref:helix-turn-helix domain-containing protein n=1 Tax=Mycobacterium sp. PDNC021 TaxID=3391399 RepID=UPI003AADBB43